MTTAHFDLDAIKYAAASAGESRTVKVTHKVSGRHISVPNRTAWYGHWKKKEGGKLAEINKGRETPFLVDDFTYEDVQTPEPIENVLHTAKVMVEKAIKECGTSSAKYYIGKGDPFRVELSTLLKYKGQRSSSLKPLLLDDVAEYLTKKFGADVVEDYEVDDVVVMNSYGKKDHFILGIDKDYAGSGSNFFNMSMPEKGIQNTSGLGGLYIDSKGYVKGVGAMFKLFQVCSSDSSDNYAANCVSDVKWGDKSAYNALKDCKNDKELFQASVGIFKLLYPEPKIVTGWRGNQFEVDWLYVMQECVNMAHLHRKPSDFIDLKSVFEKLGVEV